MATTTTYPHIVKEDGAPARLENHPRLRVSMLVTHYLAFGRSPEEICLHLPHLSAAEVYAAMTYYFDHRDEIDAELEAELDELNAEAQSKPRSPIWYALSAKGLV